MTDNSVLVTRMYNAFMMGEHEGCECLDWVGESIINHYHGFDDNDVEKSLANLFKHLALQDKSEDVAVNVIGFLFETFERYLEHDWIREDIERAFGDE